MEDCEIITLLKSEPSRGIREAVKKYRAYASAIVGRVIGKNRQDTEECVADAFVAVWRAAQSGEIRNLKGYIAYAARNTAINRYKQLERRQTIGIEELELSSGEDITLNFEDETNRLEIQKLVLGMEEPDREIFVRKYFLLESVKEIAKRTGLDGIQIKNRLYRGRQRLRRQLEERGATA